MNVIDINKFISIYKSWNYETILQFQDFSLLFLLLKLSSNSCNGRSTPINLKEQQQQPHTPTQHDTDDNDSSDDEFLPSPFKRQRAVETPQRGDLVFAKFGNFPYWPALVGTNTMDYDQCITNAQFLYKGLDVLSFCILNN